PSDYNNEGSDAEDMYSDAASPESDQSSSESDAQPEGDESDQSESDAGRTVVPKSVFGNYECKPGEKKVFEVVGVHDNEIELQFVGKEGEEEAKEKPAAPPPSEISAMME